jgi:ubiquinone/menaquinone biosynthesis C-methylase UbiE
MSRNTTIPEFVGKEYNFDKSSAAYKYRPDYPEELYRELNVRLDRLENARVIDLGSGDGRIAFRLAHLGTEIFSVDSSEPMLKIIRRSKEEQTSLNVHPIRGEATQLPFPNGSMDYIIIGQSFHWMDRQKVLKELGRVLRKNGQAVILWTQPYVPYSPSIRITDSLISEYVPHYHPESAHNLSPKNDIPQQSSFQVHRWNMEFTCVFKIDNYAKAVSSKSYVAHFLSREEIKEFRQRLTERLRQQGYNSAVEERYCLFVLFLKPASLAHSRAGPTYPGPAYPEAVGNAGREPCNRGDPPHGSQNEADALRSFRRVSHKGKKADE